MKPKQSFLQAALCIFACALFISCEKENSPFLINTDDASVYVQSFKNGSAYPAESPLIAGRTIVAGTVTVSNDDGAIIVMISTTGDWSLTNTKVWIGEDLSDLPVNKSGNPVRGGFLRDDSHDPHIEFFACPIPYSELGFIPEIGDEVIVAVYADVEMEIIEGDIPVITEEGAWAFGEPIGGRAWGWYLRYNRHEWQCGEAFPDYRDGNVYGTVQIGNQCWMSQNLAFLPAVFPPFASDDILPHFYVYGYEGFDVEQAKSTYNYNAYGALYNWTTAMNSCPDGWHLPSDAEWQTMELFLGMDPGELDWFDWRSSGSVGYKIKSASGWDNDGNGDNSSGFNALPSGFRSIRGTFSRLGEGARFYTSSEGDVIVGDELVTGAYYRYLKDNEIGVMRRPREKSWGSSVRCMKNE